MARHRPIPARQSSTLISPRAVHAVVATIIRDQDNPARHPFTTTCTGASITQVSTCNPPAIPAGQEVVIETISFTGFGDSDKSVLVPTISTIAAGFFQTYFLTPISDTGAFQPTNADFSECNQLVFMLTQAHSLSAAVSREDRILL